MNVLDCVFNIHTFITILPCTSSCGSLASVMKWWTVLCVLVFSLVGLVISGVMGVSGNAEKKDGHIECWILVTPEGTEHNVVYLYVFLSVPGYFLLFKCFVYGSCFIWWNLIIAMYIIEIVFKSSQGCYSFYCKKKKIHGKSFTFNLLFWFSDFYSVHFGSRGFNGRIVILTFLVQDFTNVNRIITTNGKKTKN